jgi:hypothetical protein
MNKIEKERWTYHQFYSPSLAGRGQGDGHRKLGRTVKVERVPYADLKTAIGDGSGDERAI